MTINMTLLNPTATGALVAPGNIAASRERLNPFSKAHFLEELRDYKGLTSSREVRLETGVKLESMRFPALAAECFCDRHWTARPEFPVLSVDDTLWMSITPMETQSAYLAIERAHGKVATGGLGLGYYLGKIAAKPDVTAIDVYERDPRVIRFFESWISEYEGQEKVRIVNVDMRRGMRGKTYDFAFVDLYAGLGEIAAYDDMKFFKRANKIRQYHHWGHEQALLSAAMIHDLKPIMLDDEVEYFEQACLEGGVTSKGLFYPKWLAKGLMKEMGRI